jgi:molybdopterin-guanine dinucleotide biosynthesis protein A
MPNTITVAILTGGQSSRMGTNKAFTRVGGVPIIERILQRIGDLGEETILITNTPAEYAHLGLPAYPDRISGKGPLGGLYTALSEAHCPYILAVSCDQPFLNPVLLQALIDQRSDVDVVVPLDREDYPQSMHAIYGKGCLPAIRDCLDAEKLKMIGFFPQVRVREIAGEDIDRYDPQRISFVNVNTPDDLAQANRLAAELEG